MAADGGTRAVVAALLANTGIALTKFIAFALTGVSSMLAEAIHSVADAGNQGLLLLGGRQSRKEATEEHPFGYGRERYIYSFMGIAIVLESLSFRTAINETRKVKGEASYAQFIRRAKQPELPVILLEDLAALLGLVFAMVAVVLSLLTENLYFDVVGTAMIGLLLVAVAITLAIETKSLLLGESAAPDAQRKIAAALESTDRFERIIHLKTLHLGPEELLVAAKVGVVRGISAEELAAAINAAETAVREAEPLAQVIYLEPDIYREDYVPAERPQPPEPVGH
jgi:divalent metal cation (Fe/Co/Zn/Cd) transporter